MVLFYPQDLGLEEWRGVISYEGRYEVSNWGQVRSLLNGRILVLKQSHAKTGGYPVVNLTGVDGRQRVYKVHVLVLEAFVGPRPFLKAEGRHRDDISTHCWVTNLEWGTSSDNKRDLVRNGRHNNASKTECKWGHEFTPENTIHLSRGGRDCRKCKNRRNRELDYRKRGVAA